MCSMVIHASWVFCHTKIPDRFRSPLSGILFRSGLLSLVAARCLAVLHESAIILGVVNGCVLWCWLMYILSISVVDALNL